MESVDAQIPQPRVELNNIEPRWNKIVISPGIRTNKLIEENSNIGKLEPIILLENIKKSDTGIVLFPGGLDRGTEDEALKWGQENNASVFHIKYPDDSSFSISSEVGQIIDHTVEKGIKHFKIMTGSWGGIPAFRTMYDLLKEEDVEVDCFVTVAAALQPKDFAPMIKNTGKLVSSVLTITKNISIPGRQTMARISSGIPSSDFDYSDQSVLDKIKEVPTLLFVPPGGKDWWINADESYKKYLPNAKVIEYPAYDNLVNKVLTIGGHDSKYAISGIRNIESQFLKDPRSSLNLPDGFKIVR